MRALVWRGDFDMRVEDREAPQPRDDEALLHVVAAGICGSDVGRFAGRGSAQPPPIVLGHELIGKVVASPGLRAGAYVAVYPFVRDGTCDQCRSDREHLCRSSSLVGLHRPGGFAEFVTVPEANCHPLATASEAGALVEPLACALHALRRAGAAPSDRLLVLGGGGLGVLTAAAAVAFGLDDVRVWDRSERRRETAAACGARVVADHTGAEDSADVVVDTVGSVETRARSIELASPGGRVVLLGLHDLELEASARRVIRDEITLIGSFAYTRSEFREAVALVDRGMLQRILSHCDMRPLTDGRRAFEELASGAAAVPRIILQPG